jgi:hypothetical protein
MKALTVKTETVTLIGGGTWDLTGARGGTVVEALHYKPEGRGIDFRWVSLECFIDIILPAALWHWG